MNWFERRYGAALPHLSMMLFTVILVAYSLHVLGVRTLWNQNVWWQSISVWFIGALIAHDLVLFPLYGLADRALTATGAVAAVPMLNYLRVPALATALTFVVFFPGIIEQGSDTYFAATGQRQDPFLFRWLLLTAGFFTASALAFAVRVIVAHRVEVGRRSRTRVPTS